MRHQVFKWVDINSKLPMEDQFQPNNGYFQGLHSIFIYVTYVI